MDKSKPVRRALEAQYEKIMQANLHQDLQGIMDLRTPGFQAHMPNGETWDFERSKEYTQRAFEQVKQNLNLRFVINEIDVHEGSAAAEIEQHWSRIQIKGGQLRRVDTSALQRETWVKTPQGWKLDSIDHIRPGAWYLDGKRIDPSRPYAPNAPPYVPADATKK